MNYKKKNYKDVYTYGGMLVAALLLTVAFQWYQGSDSSTISFGNTDDYQAAIGGNTKLTPEQKAVVFIQNNPLLVNYRTGKLAGNGPESQLVNKMGLNSARGFIANALGLATVDTIKTTLANGFLNADYHDKKHKGPYVVGASGEGTVLNDVFSVPAVKQCTDAYMTSTNTVLNTFVNNKLTPIKNYIDTVTSLRGSIDGILTQANSDLPRKNQYLAQIPIIEGKIKTMTDAIAPVVIDSQYVNRCLPVIDYAKPVWNQ